LETCSLDTLQSLLVKSKSTHERFCYSGSLTEYCQCFPFGTTLQHSEKTTPNAQKPLQRGRRCQRNSSFAAGSRNCAKTSVAPGKVKALQEHEADCGAKWRGSFARFDRDTCSWKTAQCLLLGGLEEFSETWPKWGMMRGGECSERVIPARPTSGTESGSWQTPVSDDEVNRVAGKVNSRGEPNLSAQVKMWPTPAARDSKGANSAEHCLVTGKGRKHMDQLPNAVAHGGTTTPQTWATPTASTGGPEPDGKTGRKLTTQVAGQLNPSWVEWLMGWPIGWTDLKPLETGRFQA